MSFVRRIVILSAGVVLGLTGGTAVAGAAPIGTAELCSAPATYGSYALRACIENVNGVARAYAWVSLAAGHSACTIRVRYQTTTSTTDAFDVPCPSGAVTHHRVEANAGPVSGTWRSAWSIKRNSDGHVAPKAQSPYITV